MEGKKTYGMSIHGLKMSVCLGIRSHEKMTPQPIEVDVDLTIRQPEFFEEGDVSRVVPSYSDVRSLLIESAQGHTALIENLALKFLEVCGGEPGVERVRVRIAKPMALKSGVASVVFEGGGS